MAFCPFASGKDSTLHLSVLPHSPTFCRLYLKFVGLDCTECAWRLHSLARGLGNTCSTLTKAGKRQHRSLLSPAVHLRLLQTTSTPKSSTHRQDWHCGMCCMNTAQENGLNYKEMRLRGKKKTSDKRRQEGNTRK